MAGPVGCARHSSDSATLNQQLLLAARKGDNTAVLKLIKKGANIEAKDHGGLTPLGLAADFGHADTVKLLLAKGADRVAGQASGGDVLVETARSGNFKKMQILLDMGTSLDTRQKALFVAAESEPLLLKEEATPEMVAQLEKQQKQSGPTAADYPGFDYARTVGLLLDSGLSLETREEDGATPLIRAASFGQTATVKLLLERGANVEAKDQVGITPLIAAACSCAIVDMPDTLDSVKLLLAKKANVNARANEGATALMGAASWGRTEIVQLLLESGAEVEARDKEGNTALLIASAGSALATADSVKLLLARGANVEAKNNNGDTSLLLTASKGGYERVAILKLLLRHGANPHVRDKHGITPLALATRNGLTDLIPLLKSALAKP